MISFIVRCQYSLKLSRSWETLVYVGRDSARSQSVVQSVSQSVSQQAEISGHANKQHLYRPQLMTLILSKSYIQEEKYPRKILVWPPHRIHGDESLTPGGYL